MSKVTWTEHLVHRFMNEHMFVSMNPDKDDHIIAQHLIEKEPELGFHRYNEVLAAVATWKERNPES